MTQSAFLRFRPINRLRLTVGGGLVALGLIGLTLLALNVHRQIDRQYGAKLDNVQWALSQVEIELMHLALATDEAYRHGGSLDEVRLRYDLFFSRLDILKNGKLFEELRKQSEFASCILPLERFVVEFLPLVDGPDPALRQGLGRLSEQAFAMMPEAREVALAGVSFFSTASDQLRGQSARALQAAIVLTLVLITALLGMIGLLLQLNRDNRNHAAKNLQTLSRLDSIVATAQEAIVTLDGHGRIVDFNAAATKTFGFDRAEAVGADLAQLIADPAMPQVVFQTGGPPRSWGQGQVRLTTRHKSGRSVPVELSISRTESETGDLYVAFLRDLSSQLASEQALMMARDKALAGEKAKSDLLVVMSHEIRTPLNGMIGTIDLLGATRLATKQKEYLRILEASGRLLMHHVNDVLDIARLDSGKATYSPGPVDLDDLVQEVIENQSPTARLNGNTMRYTGPAKGGAGVLVDSALLRQVLLNLVGNAVKFTRGGEIAVRITHLSPQGPTEICVSDTGIGIAAADLDRIFDDFVTLDASYARKASGTGLGLGIVRRIVERMGGSLQVDSTLGKGSLFRVLLPLPILSAVAQPQAEPAAAPLARTLLTLVVEDNDFNRMIIGDMLRQDGHEVVEAHDGQEGIALAAARRFDLIFMDISMPGVDGLQAARAIAEGPGLSRQTPVLAMTAHAQAEDVDRFKAAGMRDALIKPITRQALQRALVPLRHTPPSLLDLSVLHEMEVDLGASRAGDLLARFLAETGQTVADLVEKVHSPGLDPVSIGEIHRLEGSAAMFGALALRKALSQIQTLWKSGAMDEATLGLPGLQSLWQQTHQAYCDMGFLPQLSSLR